ncbi:response regulator [Myxococcota bacterium]|nr:response regulator [Myxococcota bacterium]
MTDRLRPQTSILIVDDEAGPRESLRMILGDAHHIHLAANGAAALDILERETIDLVTLDLDMPGMRGEELMAVLHREFPHVEVIVITGRATLQSAKNGVRMGISDYLEKPFDVERVLSSVEGALARGTSRARLVDLLSDLGEVSEVGRDAQYILEDVVQRRLHDQRRRREDADPSLLVGGQTQPSVPNLLEVIAESVETKNDFMSGHARRVAFYGSLIAQRLEASEEEVERVHAAGFLHDIGKVGLPRELLLQRGPLDDAQRITMQRHPAIGAKLVEPFRLPEPIVRAILHHHEWWDGRGYPVGLAGSEIPRSARIVAIADAYDAMTSDRPYRNAMTPSAASAELARGAGSQFDPELVETFLGVIATGVCDIDPFLLNNVVSDAVQWADGYRSTALQAS